MCSLSRLSLGAGALRLVMNRDERSERPDSRPPHVHAYAGQSALLTVDGLAGGAWIGVNQAGLAVAVLNHAPPRPVPPPIKPRSRGILVPQVLAAGTLDQAQGLLPGLPLGELPPFTLVVNAVEAARAWRWDGRRLSDADGGPLWSSSALGDHRVGSSRRDAWERLCGPTPDAARQDAWHASQLGPDSAAWVRMLRSNARTVSRTTIVIDRLGIALTEQLLGADGQPTRCTALTLGRR